MSDTAPAIVWFRNDLRLADHPALGEAVTSGRPILPLYIFRGGRTAARRRRALVARGQPRGAGAGAGRARCAAAAPRGKAADVLPDLARETGADVVHWNRPAEAMAAARDTAVAGALRQGGIAVLLGPPDLLAAPETGLSRADPPLRVFAPFWRALQQAGDPPAPLPAPARIRPYAPALASDALADWRLRPTMPDWATGLAVARQPGAAAA